MKKYDQWGRLKIIQFTRRATLPAHVKKWMEDIQNLHGTEFTYFADTSPPHPPPLRTPFPPLSTSYLNDPTRKVQEFRILQQLQGRLSTVRYWVSWAWSESEFESESESDPDPDLKYENFRARAARPAQLCLQCSDSELPHVHFIQSDCTLSRMWIKTNAS